MDRIRRGRKEGESWTDGSTLECIEPSTFTRAHRVATSLLRFGAHPGCTPDRSAGRYPPFYADDRMQLYQAILAGKIEYPRHIKKEARSGTPVVNRTA